MSALLDIDALHYAYRLSGTETLPALRGVSLRIDAGEYVAIVGANGSGKSTLARHLNALLLPDSGAVHVAGLDTRERRNLREIRRAVGMVFQHPEDQLVASVVEDDVAFGLENLGVAPAEMATRVRVALEAVDLWEERARPPHLLSAGQMQRVALAGVLALRPRCIVFDEATAMLDPVGRQAVLAMMEQLHREGVTIVAITHHMEEAARAGRVIVLQAGQIALDGSPQAVFGAAERLATWGLELPPVTALAQTLREQLPQLPPTLLTLDALAEALFQALPDTALHCPPLSGAVAPPGNPLIEVEQLSHRYMADTPLARQALRELTLTVAEGEIHGLLGATGSGKSTLMQHLNGLLRPQTGRVRVGPYELGDPAFDRRAVHRLAGLAFQMPEMQIFEQYVGDEIAYGPRLQGLAGPALRERVRWALETVGLDFDGYKDRLTFALSGGERRKVALASILALRPEILLLDEPTAGLDPGSRRELLGRLGKLRDAGMTLVLSSHQMEDLAALAERLTVLDDGAAVFSGPVREVFAQGARLRALGLGQPAVPALVEALQTGGWPLPTGILTPAELLACLPRVAPT